MVVAIEFVPLPTDLVVAIEFLPLPTDFLADFLATRFFLRFESFDWLVRWFRVRVTREEQRR